MTLSDSLPVQFWLNGQESFNQKSICGVMPVCFNQPFECDDEIKIQFQSSAGVIYNLVIYDVDDAVLYTIEFDEIESGVYQASFTPNELSPSLCERIRIEIQYGDIENGDFDGTLSPWTNEDTGTDFTYSSGQASVTLTGLSSSKYLRQTYQFVAGVTYTINWDFEDTDAYGSFAMVVRAGSTVESEIYNQSTPLTNSYSVEFTPEEDYTYIEFRINNAGVDTKTATLDNISITADRIAFSDGIDLRQSHTCTELIYYTNSSDFDGLVYETSPAPTFYLRIPAQFWKEENPQTQEDLELSNGEIVTLRQSIQEKRLLEIGYVPNYMHKKIQKILMHDDVIIDGTEWKKRDEYEAENLENYPLKQGQVLLTKYNSVKKNTI